MTTIQHYTPSGFAKIWKDSKRWRLRVGMCCPCNSFALFFPGVSEILTGSVQKYPTLIHTFNFWTFDVKDSWITFCFLIICPRMDIQRRPPRCPRCQVKFAACAQATMWTSDLSKTLVWWQWTVYVSSANVARNSPSFLCYPKCQVAKLKAEADNEFTITLKTLGATKDTQC